MRLIIVGSGIVGAACAYTATSLGAQVTLVDAGRPGQATAAGAGIICPWTAAVQDPAWDDFARAAARAYPSLVDDLRERDEADVSYRRVGALLLASDEDQLEQARQRLIDRRAEAPEIGEVTLLDSAQARDLFPPLRHDVAAVHVAGAARVDGQRLAAALIRAATRQGATVRTGEASLNWQGGRVDAARVGGAQVDAARVGSAHAGGVRVDGVRVDGVRVDGARVTGVTIDGHPIEADAVVAAAGAWTAPFVAPAGVTVRVVPQRGQIAHIGLEGTDTSRWPVVLPSATGHYLLAFDGSRVVAGATRETGSGFDVRITPGGLAEVLANALAVAPGLSAGTYLQTRVGLRPAGPDIRPLLGPVSGVEGLVVATGLGASGLTMGPLAGAVAARLALGLPPSPPEPQRPVQPGERPVQPGLQAFDIASFDPLR